MALLSNMETAVTAIWDAESDDFRDVAVCGFGSIGSLLASALRLTSDADPVVVEADSWRRSRATELGFQTCEPSKLRDEFHVCFNTTGSASGLQWCIDHACTDGTVVELSWYGNRSVTLALGQRFHYNRIRIVSSQVSTIPVHMQERFGIADRKQMSAELLSDDCFDELITNEIAFEESPQFFDLLRRGGQGDGVVWVIKY
jgi:threonine dehydrogenase-like Zn-dependent dehydrogenase